MPTSRRTHPDACEHDSTLVKVAMARVAGSWTAVCAGCLGRWVYTDEQIPDSVLAAVRVAVEMVSSPAAGRPRTGSRSSTAPHRRGGNGLL